MSYVDSQLFSVYYYDASDKVSMLGTFVHPMMRYASLYPTV